MTVNLANQTEGFTITGLSGSNIITGGSGADSITGGTGADTIVGAQNDTLLDGGGGTDTLNIGASFTSTSDAQIANIENITLTASRTTLNLANQTRLSTLPARRASTRSPAAAATIQSPAAPAPMS